MRSLSFLIIIKGSRELYLVGNTAEEEEKRAVEFMREVS